MAENLKTTKYIPLVSDSTEWRNLLSPGYCWYDNDIANKDEYGALYNWYAVDASDLCPIGWHVPTYDEWELLVSHLGGKDVAGGKLKETGTRHWESPNTGATNESGFTALPSGTRGSFDAIGIFVGLGTCSFWWSSTYISGPAAYADDRSIIYSSSKLFSADEDRRYGNSVRCVKN
jgi:uncharacterized protein (TIGR02145 family)